ncbi:MAG: hypothetical protein KA004_15050 [Verrucomicrobiales bacterium]|nr:hypothetical protein [Verrucomicrobiales bacterium]
MPDQPPPIPPSLPQTAPNVTVVMPQPAFPPQRSSGKCWFWGCGGCLGLLVIGVVGVFFMARQVLGVFADAPPYKMAVEEAQRSPEVQEALGQPVEAKKFAGVLPFTGSININNDSGTADLQIPVAGPKGQGTVHSVAKKSIGQPWEFSVLEVTVDGTGKKIPLRAPAAAPAIEPPAP